VFKYVKSSSTYDATPVPKLTLASVTRSLTRVGDVFCSHFYGIPANRWLRNWRLHSFVVENYCLLACDAVYSGRYISIIRTIIWLLWDIGTYPAWQPRRN